MYIQIHDPVVGHRAVVTLGVVGNLTYCKQDAAQMCRAEYRHLRQIPSENHMPELSFSDKKCFVPYLEGTGGRRLFSVDHQNTHPSIWIFCSSICSAVNTSSGYSALLWLRSRKAPAGRR